MNGAFFKRNDNLLIGEQSIKRGYSYLPLVSKNGEKFKHPINVYLSKNSIDFCFSAFRDGEFITYSSKLFLSLSLIDNNVEDLHSTLKTSFELSENKNLVEEKDRKEIEKVALRSVDYPSYKIDDFFVEIKGNTTEATSSINTNDAVDEGANNTIKNTLSSTANVLYDFNDTLPTDQFLISNRNLIIHFFSDFFYSQVFIDHPDYQKIKAFLSADTFVRAILAKAYYSHCLSRVSDLRRNETKPKEKKYWNKELKSATKKWLGIIREKDSDKTINIENQWFNDIEIEHQEVLEEQENRENIIGEEVESSIDWLVKRYSLVGAFFLQFKYVFFRDNKHKGAFSLGFVLSGFVLAFILTNERNFSLRLNEVSISWVAYFLLLIIAGVGLWFGRSKYSSIHPLKRKKNDQEDPWWTSGVIPFALILGLAICFCFDYRYETIVFYTTFIFSGFILSTIGAIAIERLFYLVASFFKSIASFLEKTVPFFKYIVSVNLTTRRKTTEIVLSITKISALFRPKILLASASVWAVIFNMPVLWNIDFKIRLFEGCILVFLGTCLFLYLFSKFDALIKTRSTKYNVFENVFRSSSLILLGFTYSFIIGIGVISQTIQSSFVKEGYYKDYFAPIAASYIPVAKTYAALPHSIKKSDNIIDTIIHKMKNDTLINISMLKRLPIEKHEILFNLYKGKHNFNKKYKGIDSLTLTKIDTLLRYTDPKKDINKELLIKLVPHLKGISERGELPSFDKAVLHLSVKTPAISSIKKEDEKPLLNIYILPELLLFYSFIAMTIGVFVEMGFNKKE